MYVGIFFYGDKQFKRYVRISMNILSKCNMVSEEER